MLTIKARSSIGDLGSPMLLVAIEPTDLILKLKEQTTRIDQAMMLCI
jgi:hypothetical protein